MKYRKEILFTFLEELWVERSSLDIYGSDNSYKSYQGNVLSLLVMLSHFYFVLAFYILVCRQVKPRLIVIFVTKVKFLILTF